MTATRGPRILVVDDNPFDAALISAQLEGIAAVDIAPDPLTALYLRDRHEYDAVIVDVCLPKLAGNTLVWILRALHGDRPMVLLVSAKTEDELAALAGKCGANATLMKPFSAAALVAIVKPWLPIRDAPDPSHRE